jgi:spoIIIJ-associated protein
MTQPTDDAPETDDRENDISDSDATDGGEAADVEADVEPADGSAGERGATDGEAGEDIGGDGSVGDGSVGDGGAGDAEVKTAPSRSRRGEPDLMALEREGEIAADYLEELLDIADLDGDIDMDVERDRAAVSVVGGDLDHLVGDEGVVLEALQELTRLAVLTQTGERSRLMLDVAGYRAGRRAVLSELGRTTAEQVKSSGEPARLNPMTPFERKIVHDAVAAAGLRSESEGEEPQRRVVVLPA